MVGNDWYLSRNLIGNGRFYTSGRCEAIPEERPRPRVSEDRGRVNISPLLMRIAATESVVRADEKLSAFVELESAIRICGELS